MKRLEPIFGLCALLTLVAIGYAWAKSTAAPECPAGQDCATPTRTRMATTTITPTPEPRVIYTPTVQPPDAGMIYLPLIHQPQIRLGVQLEQLDIRFVTPGGVIYYALRWHDIERTRGVYAWPDLSALAGYRLVLDFKTTPGWAVEFEHKLCSAPLPLYYDDFARFVVAAVDRYRPVVVSIWNEPDAIEEMVAFPELYGCVDNPNVYADLVIAAYDALRASGSQIPLSGGEFMLDAFPSAYVETVLSRTIGKMDILSFHYYAWSLDDVAGLQERIDYLRGLTDLPLWLSETAMICETGCGDEFERAQEEYLQAVYALPLDYILWYTGGPNGWRNSDLVREDGTTRPAWLTYRMLTGR